jgi:4-diphosphocytidyl-2-C-methyl-D-erythritol kinase
LFGLYRTEADAEAAQARTAEYAGRSFRTTTLTREAYWSSMFV